MVSARRHRIAAIGPLLIALVVSSVLVAAPAQASAAGDFLSMTNAARAANGLPAYTQAADLTAVAQNWANQMASTGVLAHNPNYSKQITNWKFVGENVGVGPGVQAIQDAFMNSPKHRANVLDTDFTQVGIATATAIDSRCDCEVLYVAVNFRMPKGTAAPVQPPPVKPAPAQPPAPSTAAASKPAATKAATSPAKPASPASTTSKPANRPTTTGPAGESTADPTSDPVQSPTPSASALATQLATAAGNQATSGHPDPVSRALDFTAVMGLFNA